MRWSQSDSQHVFSYVLKYSKHQITKKLRVIKSVMYFLCCKIELFIHSCSIERKQTITDHCIKYCKALDITNNSQIWGTSILIKNGSKVRKKSFHHLSLFVGLSAKISRCKHLQKIIVNWLVMRNSILRQQSLSFIDYIYLNKSKSYVGDMQAKVKHRKITLENFAALIVFFSPEQREITQVNQQPTTGLRVKMLWCICAHIFKKHSDKSIAQATVFQSLTVAVSSKGLVLLSLLKRNLTNECCMKLNVSINYNEKLNSYAFIAIDIIIYWYIWHQHIKKMTSNTKQKSPRVGVEPAKRRSQYSKSKSSSSAPQNSLGLLGINTSYDDPSRNWWLNSVPISNIYTYTLLQTWIFKYRDR